MNGEESSENRASTKSPEDLLGYYGPWREKKVTCSECSWSGWGKELVNVDDSTSMDFVQMGCPKCHELILHLSNPTISALRKNLHLLRPEDRVTVEKQIALHDVVRAQALRDPSQLPDIPGEEKFELVFDVEYESEADVQAATTVILHGSAEIWRESHGAGPGQYMKIADVVKSRYGDRLTDLRPTDAAWLAMQFDSHHEQWLAHEARRRVRGEAKGAG